MTPDSSFTVAKTKAELRSVTAAWRAERLSVGYVPTMGALHGGHISLVRLACARADRVVASIFVNPAQFAAHEDLDTYPRTPDADLKALADAGCHLAYLPDPAEIYPTDFSTSVRVGGVSEGLEAATRPHFFGGVATVVAKLLNQTRPDFAVFGEKDYQQLLVVRRLARDLDLDVEIVAGPTEREKDGLAMSSRNARLSPAGRVAAGLLNRVLFQMADRLRAGDGVESALAFGRDAISLTGVDRIDYLEVRDAETLAETGDGPIRKPVRILATVYVDGVRLLDNVAAAPASP